MKLCLCGCGNQVAKPKNNFVIGHYANRKEKKISEQHKQKMRESTLKRIVRQNGPISFNEKSIPFFNLINEKFKMDALYGVNEYKCIGYSLDFYSEKFNIVIEWNEEKHYNGKKLTDRHKKRQEQIKKYLGCKFINVRQRTFNEKVQVAKIRRIICHA